MTANTVSAFKATLNGDAILCNDSQIVDRFLLMEWDIDNLNMAQFVLEEKTSYFLYVFLRATSHVLKMFRFEARAISFKYIYSEVGCHFIFE